MVRIYTFLIFFLFSFSNLSASRPKFDGCFLTFEYGATWSEERWLDEVQTMHDRGIRTIILAYSVDETTAYYPSELKQVSSVNSSPIENVLKACDSINQNTDEPDQKMEVFLGLVRKDSWDEILGSDDDVNVATELCKLKCYDIQVFNEVNTLYGGYECVSGYFIGHEIGNYKWRDDIQRLLIDHLLAPLTEYIADKQGSRKIAISPYFNNQMSLNYLQPDEYASWWSVTLDAVENLDILLVQDGIGARKSMTLEDSMEYSAAISQVAKAEMREYWADIEAFQKSDFNIPPEDLTRIPNQMSAQQEFANRMVFWQWWTLAPTLSYDRLMNANALESWQTKNYITRNIAKETSYTISPPPSNSRPDSIEDPKLTDGTIGIIKDYRNHVGWENVNESIEILLNLGSIRENIVGVQMTVLHSTESEANLPISIHLQVGEKENHMRQEGKLTHRVEGDEWENLYEFKPPQPLSCQHVKIVIRPSTGWLLISEVLVLGPSTINGWTAY